MIPVLTCKRKTNGNLFWSVCQAASEDELRLALGLAGYTTGKGKADLKDSNIRPIEVFMCSVVRPFFMLHQPGSAGAAPIGFFPQGVTACIPGAPCKFMESSNVHLYDFLFVYLTGFHCDHAVCEC